MIDVGAFIEQQGEGDNRPAKKQKKSALANQTANRKLMSNRKVGDGLKEF